MQESLSTSQPSGGNSVVAAEVQVIGCHPHRHPGGTAHVTGLPVGAVRALARRERLSLVALPPGRAAQPLPRFGSVAASTASSKHARASSHAAFRSATRPAASGSFRLTSVEAMRRPYLPREPHAKVEPTAADSKIRGGDRALPSAECSLAMKASVSAEA